MARKKWLGVLLVGVLFCAVGTGLLLKNRLDEESVSRVREKYPDRGIPRVDIALRGVNLENLKLGPKDIKYGGNELVFYDENLVNEYENVEIKGRGNSTWGQPKEPYQIKFETGVDLLGVGKKAKKWVLLANYLDVSEMRNDVALLLAEMVGVEYNQRGRFVELYLNGEYEGLYYAVNKIEVAKSSVDLREHDGVLFELDTLYGGYDTCYYSYSGECMVLRDAVVDGGELGVQEFLSDLNKVEVALEGGNYDVAADMIDIESFARYFLVNEFTVNPDAYSSSFFIYKDGTGDKIHVGPVWDFDFALANREWVWQVDEKFFSPTESMVRKREAFGLEGIDSNPYISKMMYHLMDIDEFKDEVKRVFQDRMSGRKEEFVREIKRTVNEINEALEVDNERWKKGDFESEINDILEWICTRYDYFEQEYGDDSRGNSDVKFL